MDACIDEWMRLNDYMMPDAPSTETNAPSPKVELSILEYSQPLIVELFARVDGDSEHAAPIFPSGSCPHVLLPRTGKTSVADAFSSCRYAC